MSDDSLPEAVDPSLDEFGNLLGFDTQKLSPQPTAHRRTADFAADVDMDQVAQLCSIMCTQREISAVTGASIPTLNEASRRYGYDNLKDFYEHHKGFGTASLRRRQMEVAMQGHAGMLMHMGKQHLGQSDKSHVDHSSTDGSMSPGDSAIAKLSAFLMKGKPNDSNAEPGPDT